MRHCHPLTKNTKGMGYYRHQQISASQETSVSVTHNYSLGRKKSPQEVRRILTVFIPPYSFLHFISFFCLPSHDQPLQFKCHSYGANLVDMQAADGMKGSVVYCETRRLKVMYTIYAQQLLVQTGRYQLTCSSG